MVNFMGKKAASKHINHTNVHRQNMNKATCTHVSLILAYLRCSNDTLSISILDIVTWSLLTHDVPQLFKV